MLNRPLILGMVLALILGPSTVAYAQSTAPTVSEIRGTSNPGADQTYAPGIPSR